MGLVASLQGRRVYLDTNVFIYALNGFPAYAPSLTELFDSIDTGHLAAVTSELSLAEALVIPFRRNSIVEEQRCREIFRPGPGMELFPVNMSVLEGMARIRAETPAFRAPDAIHAATARLSRCDTFLTNDLRFKAAAGFNVLFLNDVASP